MSESSSCSKVELAKFHAAEAAARGLNAASVRRHRQRRLLDVFVIHGFPLDPTPGQLRRFYQRVTNRYEDIASFTIPVVLPDGIKLNIPVTPPDDEEATFHIIVLRGSDGATVEILVEESSNYIIGFRVYLNEEEKDSATWFLFTDENKDEDEDDDEEKSGLPDYFTPWQRIKYSLSYGDIENKVLFGAGVIQRIFDFLFSFRANPSQAVSKEGDEYLHTLFLILGEAQRFKIARDWLLAQLRNPVLGRPIKPMFTVFRDWSSLCKCCFSLMQYNVEIPFLDELTDDAKETSVFAPSRISAFRLWQTRENRHKNSGMTFRRGDGKIILEALVGGQLLLLNHDDQWCTRYRMRQSGYKGRWFAPLDLAMST